MWSLTVWSAVLCAISFIQGVSGQVNLVDHVNLSVNPPTFVPGQTTAVTINCTFFKSRNSNFVTVHALRLLDAVSNNVVIAQIDLYSRPVKANAYGVGLTATGDINGAVGGFLTGVWYPNVTYGLLFTCEAEGVNSNGVAIRVATNATLDPRAPTTPAPVTAGPTQAGRVTATPGKPSPFMTMSLVDSLKATIVVQSKLIADLQARCSAQVPSVTSTPAPVTVAPLTAAPVTVAPVTAAPVTAAPVTAAPATLAPAAPGTVVPQQAVQSGAYLGHHYVLSTPATTNITLGGQFCASLGGYLAEIADQNEYNFLINFLNSNSIIDQVFIGIEYSEFLRDFQYMKTGTAPTYLQWDQFSHQPHIETGHHCVVIIPGNNNMHVTVCGNSFKRRYLCEV